MERKKIILELDLVDWTSDMFDNNQNCPIGKGKCAIVKNETAYDIVYRHLDGNFSPLTLPLEIVEKYITKEVAEDKVEEITNSLRTPENVQMVKSGDALNKLLENW
jgi:hypothetical protein